MIRKNEIEEIYRKYHKPEYLEIDPLLVVRRYLKSEMLAEIALTAALLSYGRVAMIIRALESILAVTDGISEDFIDNTDLTQKQSVLSSFKYRFHTGNDIALLFTLFRDIREEYTTLTSFAQALWDSSEGGEQFFNLFTGELKRRGRNYPGVHRNYFDWLLPSPSSGSPCKRVVMFFRWMARESDGIDLGVWPFIEKKELVIPVDTHVANVAQQLGLTGKKTTSWKMALEITDNLKRFSPEDPVKYDFSLCRAGMVGDFKQHRKK